MKEHNELVISEDGSHTLLSKNFGVTYHSTHGAIQESITVFLSAGLQYARTNFDHPVKILEMGFGTGLNALLTLIEAEQYKLPVHYTSLEAYPISVQEAEALNYIDFLNTPQLQETFNAFHAADSKEILSSSKYFTFQKHITKIEDFQPENTFNVVYYDAFAPTTQPHLWDEKMMAHIYQMLDDQAILVSYCAKGSFKRALRAAGFKVESLMGPPGKREMVRAVKDV